MIPPTISRTQHAPQPPPLLLPREELPEKWKPELCELEREEDFFELV
jgi:hypothetical protein